MINYSLTNFLEVASQLNDKSKKFITSAYHPDIHEFSSVSEVKQRLICKKYFENEIIILSNWWQLSHDAALVLAALIICYQNPITSFLHFIHSDTWCSALALNCNHLPHFDMALQELEQQNMIKVNELDFSFLEAVSQIDKNVYDNFGLPYQKSLDFRCNRTFELTDDFINELQST